MFKSSTLVKPISIVIGMVLILTCINLAPSNSVFAQEEIAEVVSTSEVIAGQSQSSQSTPSKVVGNGSIDPVAGEINILYIMKSDIWNGPGDLIVGNIECRQFREKSQISRNGSRQECIS